MDKFKIVLFLCNWGPHGAYQALQDNAYKIPSEVKMVRIPCTGRISKALLFKAFEMGADGVALVGCRAGSCRYGSGTETGRDNTADIGRVLEILSLGEERMRLATFLPDQAEELLSFMEGFVSDVKAMGKTPVVPRFAEETEPVPGAARLATAHSIHNCQDCGKCTASCPLALAGKAYSPRAIAAAVINGDISSVEEDIWSCLTCGICYDRCPSDVNFPEFIRDMRNMAGKGEDELHQAHGGFFQSLMRSMTSPGVKPGRWADLPAGIELDPEGKTLFFGGCAPYFDVFFRKHLGVDTSKILVDSLRLLNFFDIKPRVLTDEKCCGHDLLWSGDKEGFLLLARENMAAIKASGVEEVVTACPECYRTLAVDYPAHGIEVDFKVTHIYDLLEERIDKGAVEFSPLDRNITYQDPCRLARSEDTKDLSRKLLKRLVPDSFTEMKERGNSALCCGNCAWTGCDAAAKALQKKRLGQARETGSDLLVTSCPKCQIHLKCAMEDPFLKGELAMETADLTSVVADTIRWE